MRTLRILLAGVLLTAMVGCGATASDVSDKDVKDWAAPKGKDGKPDANAAANSPYDER